MLFKKQTSASWKYYIVINCHKFMLQKKKDCLNMTAWRKTEYPKKTRTRTHNLSGERKGTDCTSSCKSNYHTSTTAPRRKWEMDIHRNNALFLKQMIRLAILYFFINKKKYEIECNVIIDFDKINVPIESGVFQG